MASSAAFRGSCSAACVLLLLIPYNAKAQNSEDKQFRRGLTQEELVRLEAGEIVTKTAKIFLNSGRSYQVGPLRAERISAKEFRFTPFGKWQQTEKEGYMSCEWEYTGVPRESVTHFYNPDGSLHAVLYVVPAVLKGDSVREHRMVYFKTNTSNDTACVEHIYKKNGKSLRGKTTWSYDTRGLRPVPPGWKFSQ